MFIDSIKERAKLDKKTIILPESMDSRVLEAASIILNEDICNLIIIGDKANISSRFNLDKAMFIDPKSYYFTEELANKLYELRRDKGLSLLEAKRLVLEKDFDIIIINAPLIFEENEMQNLSMDQLIETNSLLIPCVNDDAFIIIISYSFLKDLNVCLCWSSTAPVRDRFGPIREANQE